MGIRAIGEVGDPDPYTRHDRRRPRVPPRGDHHLDLSGDALGLAAPRPDRARPRRHRRCRSTHVVNDIDAEGLPFHVTLAVANRTASGDELLEALQAKAEAFSEPGPRQLFIVVVPQEGGHGHAAQRARTRLKLVLDRLRVRGLYAAGMIGDPDPFTAITNALQYFRVDDIVISTFAETKSGWLRSDLIERVRRATGKPVEHVVHEDDRAAAA